jgi:ATP-binding cassette subfamily B protein
MHKGQLREIGSHQELLAQRGLYWKLYQLQYKDQEQESGVGNQGSSDSMREHSVAPAV